MGNSVQRVNIELQDFRSMLGLGDDEIPAVAMCVSSGEVVSGVVVG